jgi:zinc-finger-containing domain
MSKNRPTVSKDPYKNGSRCPYCHRPTEYVDSSVIYGKSYGMIYLCRPCMAYCGVHQGTNISLGRLANEALREAKKEAHKYFNMIYEGGHMTRKEAYAWLCSMLEIPRDETHIGMFDEKLCADTVLYAKQFLNDMRRLDLDFGVEPKTPYFDTTNSI